MIGRSVAAAVTRTGPAGVVGEGESFSPHNDITYPSSLILLQAGARSMAHVVFKQGEKKSGCNERRAHEC